MNEESAITITEPELIEMLDALYAEFHHDFRRYSRASLRRRLSSAARRFGCASLGELRRRLAAQPQQLAELLGILTVPVSELFRDPGYFKALREQVVPLLGTYPSLRVWVAGCATGEEAWSLAIVLHEAGLLERTLIYATDINPAALRTAESGVYALDRLAGWSESYLQAGGTASLSEYYTAAYEGALLDRRLRRAILFSDHSLATDSAFAEVQLVSCRNVLIYFDRELQDRALGLFRDSLVRRGVLGLGRRETLRFSAHARAFEVLDLDERLYQKL